MMNKAYIKITLVLLLIINNISVKAQDTSYKSEVYQLLYDKEFMVDEILELNWLIFNLHDTLNIIVTDFPVKDTIYSVAERKNGDKIFVDIRYDTILYNEYLASDSNCMYSFYKKENVNTVFFWIYKWKNEEISIVLHQFCNTMHQLFYIKPIAKNYKCYHKVYLRP